VLIQNISEGQHPAIKAMIAKNISVIRDQLVI
jgi:hypothetical protein